MSQLKPIRLLKNPENVILEEPQATKELEVSYKALQENLWVEI